MKKILFLVLAMAVAFSCQKKELETPNADVEVVFGIQKVDPNDGLKSTPPPICPTDGNGNLLVPDHASIWISVGGGAAVEYTPTVFELNGMLYTQAIKFASANGASVTYTVEDFVLYAGTTPIMATPGLPPAAYAEYTTIHVPFTFEVNAFEKMEVPVEVLCYLPELYEYFGFTWFEITEIVVREFCFFGDICLNGYPFTPADFDGSDYGTGLGVDVPAIMKIVVKDEYGVEVPNSPFNNESTLGIGEPLCVQYPDRLNVQDEVFTFDLYVWTKLCDGTFDYMYFDTFTATDDSELDLPVGTDNILDFVVGTCSYADADIVYGHFEWLAIQDFFDAPNGWVVTSDPTAGPIYRWSPKGVGTTGYANIAPPIAHFLNKAGYAEPALLGFESIYHDTPLQTGGVGSASIYGLLQAYLTTNDSKFETAAQTAWPLYEIKYPSDGLGNVTYYGVWYPRTGLWAYDYFQSLFCAKMAAAEGYFDAATYLSDATARYLRCVAGTEPGMDPMDDYQKIFVNAIAAELNIGTFQGTCDWAAIKAANDLLGYSSNQEAAYGLMGGSWADPDVVKAYIKANICTAQTSEEEAEALYAIGL